MFEVEKYSQAINAFEKKVKQTFETEGILYSVDYESKELINIVFAGQYSAGKSSILKMLTGREDIAIGGGITTQQTHEYDWNGLKVVDTPGIHTELRPDHDEIAYAEIAAADILVYVITYNLFDPHIGKNFRKLAIDKDKAAEMILVINKMNDTAKGNVPEQQNILKEALGFKDVITPYTPDQLNVCFLDAESYLDSLKERNSDPEFADELYKRSGYENFINTLNDFVKEKGISSKLTTRLYLISDELEAKIKNLQPKSEDSDIDALEEHLEQQRSILSERKNTIQQQIEDIYTNAASSIRNLGLDAANLLTEGCKQSEVEALLDKKIKEVEAVSEECEKNATLALKNGFDDIDSRLEEFVNSDFSKKLTASLSGKFDQLPDKVKKILGTIGFDAKNIGTQIMNNAYNAASNGGLKLTNFSGSAVHNMVLKVGKGLGVKFKPWQAIKITRGVAIAGQVLNFLGVGLSIFMQIKSDIDEEKVREDLRTNRQNIRSQFNEVASQLMDSGKKVIKENVTLPLNNSIMEIDRNIQAIRETREHRSETCLKLEKLQSECQDLIQKIHSL